MNTSPAVPAVAVAVYDEKNAALNMDITLVFTDTSAEAWEHYAVKFASAVQEIGGYMGVVPKLLNDFAYKCPRGASEVRSTLFWGITREYDEKLFGDKDVLVKNERRVAGYISLVSMLAPAETEAVIKKIESAYAGFELAVPEQVTAKIGERRKVFAEFLARREERQLAEVRRPYLRARRDQPVKARCDYVVSLGYRMDINGCDIHGNVHFSRKDPQTGKTLKVTVDGGRGESHQRQGGRRGDRQPEVAAKPVMINRVGAVIEIGKHKPIVALTPEQQAQRDKERREEKAAKEVRRIAAEKAAAEKAKKNKSGGKRAHQK